MDFTSSFAKPAAGSGRALRAEAPAKLRDEDSTQESKLEGMTYEIAPNLNLAKRLLLTSAGAVALAGAFVIGMLNSAKLWAQQQLATPLAFEVASVNKHQAGDRRGGYP